MNLNNLNRDTIVAVSTPHGMGGIAVVRVSGPDALTAVEKRWNGARLDTMQSHTAHLGQLLDSQGELLDEVVLTLYRAPHSFTGEDVVEIACHGSVWIQRQLMNTLIDAGCRAATGGEFTQRAFANGKMDLSQAEAIADVIASGSRASHRVAMNQMRGAFGRELSVLRSQLLQFVSLIELELDFSEEDVSFADRSKLIDLATDIHSVITRLADSFQAGNAIKNGLPVAIVGASNAGKSTLLNALLRDDKALVSDIAGTTRDVIEDTMVLGGVQFRFIDTAGIRESVDVIENMGIERSFQKMDEAQLVLWVIDATAPLAEVDRFVPMIAEHCHDKQLIAVVNKTDVADGEPVAEALHGLLPEGAVIAPISAKSAADVERLEQLIVERAMLPEVDSEALIVTNARHYEALVRAGEAIERAIEGLQGGVSGDFVSQDIRECMHYLGEITGEITTDEILGEIFSHFCIGK
ncbi:MAG: tRNA uridine-5-carboxymethylaminomethyl(34) synthesis GTPase MnmE [Muribaculaceae bacterium]|nr:tRNA uridine-5-carboxymethylaminomethyl(34) synthesis GTPase MnmE [Muribaculaceae bacterium]